MIRSKLGQRLLGIVFFAGSLAFLVWEYKGLKDSGEYYPKAAVMFPALGIFGLGMLFFPVDYDALRAEHGVERLSLFRHYPPVWKVIFFLALGAGFLNWYLEANVLFR